MKYFSSGHVEDNRIKDLQALTSQASRLQTPQWLNMILAYGIMMVPSISYGGLAHSPVNSAFTLPVAPSCISSPFGPRVLPNRPLAGVFHNGIDLPAPIGAPVRAIAPGIVIRVQKHGVGGLEILVQHEGFIGVYSHLGLVAPMIAEGRKTVNGGEQLATVGRTGVTYGPHLYFEMIVGGHPVDPVPYLGVKACSATVQAATDQRIPPTRRYSAP